MVKQYSFFNSPLQMEAPELVPTPTPRDSTPWTPDTMCLPQPGWRKRGTSQDGPLEKNPSHLRNEAEDKRRELEDKAQVRPDWRFWGCEDP